MFRKKISLVTKLKMCFFRNVAKEKMQIDNFSIVLKINKMVNIFSKTCFTTYFQIAEMKK